MREGLRKLAASALFVFAVLLYLADVSASVLRDGDLAFSRFEVRAMLQWLARFECGKATLGCRHDLVPTVRTNPRTGEPLFVGTFGPFLRLIAPPMPSLAQSLGARLWEDAPTVFLVEKLKTALLLAASAELVRLLSFVQAAGVLAYAPGGWGQRDIGSERERANIDHA